MMRFAHLPQFAVALAGFAAAAGIVAIGASARPVAAEETVRLAFLKTLAIVPMIDAQEMGYFSKEGLKVQMITLNNGPAVVSAVVGGSADIGFSATLPVISAVAEHQPIREFMISSVERWPLEEGLGESLIASARSGIKTLQDLKGKTLASNATNGGCDLMIRDHIRAAGIPASAVKMVVIPFPQMKAALELGTVDAVCAVAPFSSAIMASPQIKPTVIAEGIIADLPQVKSFAIAGYFARADWLAKNKAAAAAFLRAMVAADEDLAAHKEKYHHIIVDEFKMSAEIAGKIGFQPNMGSVVAEPQQLETPIAALVRTGLLKEAIPAAGVVFTIQP
jgi:ABC-type nitrate/sulfonate/bicarbonate transport system substrate-binding protein